MFTVGQIFGLLILGGTVLVPGLSLAGFHGGTNWSALGWVCVASVGGFLGGLLLAPKHRIAGAIGGMVGAPLGMLALYFYARNRDTIYRAEATLVTCVGALPGFLLFFVLRLLTDLVFPAAPAQTDDDDYEEDEYDKPSRRHKRARDDDEDEDDDNDDEDEDVDDRPRHRHRGQRREPVDDD